MTYFIANFKQHFTLDELAVWVQQFSTHTIPKADAQVILAPAFTQLHPLKRLISLPLAAQNVSTHLQGAHTGQVGAPQLQGLADFCIIGHSEVRAQLGDNDKDIAIKAKLLEKASITPIVCLDISYLESQLTALKHQIHDLSRLIFAYEPKAAIGSGKPETPAKANEIAFKIKHLTGKTCPVLYGGSVTPDNAKSFLAEENIDGFIVGTASLTPTDFAKIISSV